MITPSRHHPRVRRRRGFSLIELLLAIFILGVGIISVAAVFPAGIIQQRRTQDDVLGPVIAEDGTVTAQEVKLGDVRRLRDAVFEFLSPPALEATHGDLLRLQQPRHIWRV